MIRKQICTNFLFILLLLVGIPSALVAQQNRLVFAGGGASGNVYVLEDETQDTSDIANPVEGDVALTYDFTKVFFHDAYGWREYLPPAWREGYTRVSNANVPASTVKSTLQNVWASNVSASIRSTAVADNTITLCDIDSISSGQIYKVHATDSSATYSYSVVPEISGQLFVNGISVASYTLADQETAIFQAVRTLTNQLGWRLVGSSKIAIGTSEIVNSAVTFAKMQNIATNSLLGRFSSGTGLVENPTIDATSLKFTGGVLGVDAAVTNYWTLSSGNLWRNSNVGVGIDPSTTARLVVRGNGASTGLAFLVENNSGTDNFWITDAGNATMGTITSGQINITTTGGSTHAIRAANFSTGTSVGLIQSNTNVPNAIGYQMLAWNAYVSGARYGQWISMQMRDTIGSLFVPSGIKLYIDQGAVANAVGGISFYNATGVPTVGLTEPAFLTEVGTIVGRNWGINDNTPDFLFDVEGKLAARHFIAQGANPTIVVGAGAGTGASVTVTTADISDAAGRLDVVMGSSGTAGGTLATFTFATAFTKAPIVKLQAENGNTAEVWTDIWVVPTTTGFTIECDADLQPLIGASITLKISYQIIGVD